VWDLVARAECYAIDGHPKSVTAAAVSPDGTLLAITASYEGTVRLFDLASGSEKAWLKGHTGVVRSLAFAPDGRALAGGSGDGAVKIWNLDRFRPTAAD
jgi:WD40 repeat protein